MTKGTLPPQAYTREMLTLAFQWVQSQPESIRKLADSADALVGLYLRAKRSGDASLEASAPVSTENFRANLKSLATELQQFSSPPAMTSIPSATHTPASVVTHSPAAQPLPLPPLSFQFSDQFEKFDFQIDKSSAEKANERPSEKPSEPSYAPIRVTPVGTPANAVEALDPKSRIHVQRVQNRFNLSSESEALRMLIALGAERIEKL